MTKTAVKKQSSTKTKSKKNAMKAPAKKTPKKLKIVASSPKISLMVAVLRLLKVKPLSAPQIAKNMKMGVPAIYTCVADLKKKNLIESKLGERGGRGRTGNVFFLTDTGTEEIKKIGIKINK